MAKYTRFINDEQWKLLEPLVPKQKRNPEGGKPNQNFREKDVFSIYCF